MIEVENLTKRYPGTTAVDSASFVVETGSVTGFLGPNGAGKSTCLRMLVGLCPPTSGQAHIFGRRYVELPNPATLVGTLLDAGAHHRGRTGRESLRVRATAMGLPLSRVDAALERVGLTRDEARSRVGGYSLGMRQRLGLAQALLGDPRVLVLDEPANGLDPGGIRWMRELLREFADGGGTVLLSSHLLSEVEHVADAYVLIGNGRILRTGRREEFTGAAATLVSSTADDRLLETLRHRRIGAERVPSGLRVAAPSEQVGEAAFTANVQLRELTPLHDDLEHTFMRILGSESREQTLGTQTGEEN